MHEELLAIVRCPSTQSRLRFADSDLVERINASIGQGEIHNQVGIVVDHPFEAGLVNDGNTLIYPIYDGVPYLMIDEAISLRDLNSDS